MANVKNWHRKGYAAMYNSVYAEKQKLNKLLKKLEINSKDRLIDFGCGDGSFLKLAAEKAAFCFGVDASNEQIRLARKKLFGLKNVKIIKKDFLKFSFKGEKFTKGFSRKALHHLNDEEKKLFFKNIGSYFCKGALFFIEDGVFSFERKDLGVNWDKLIKDAAGYYGKTWNKKKKDVIYCFKKEYPTSLNAWRAALEAGGFKVLKVKRESSFYAGIKAVKIGRS